LDTGYLARRLVRTIVVLLGLSTVVFVVIRLSGDPVSMLLPRDTPPAEVETMRRHLGLDASLPTQYVRFLALLARGDLGVSLHQQQPALRLVLERLPATLELAIAAFVVAILIAVPAGILCASHRGGLLDQLVMSATLVGQSVPTFWLGIVLILVVAVQLHLLPTSGTGALRHLVLPAVTLATQPMASVARLTRAAMLDVLDRDYVRTARAKGLGERRVVWRHALKNAFIPVLTIAGLQLGSVLAGAVITETVFSWPGIGRLAIQAIAVRDYPVVQAVVIVTSMGFVVVNLVVDLLYRVLDPRIRYT
jgi:peptide/nickel transport system permease protein